MMAAATRLFLALVGGLSLAGPAAAADLHCEGTISSRAGGTVYAAYDPRSQPNLFGPGVVPRGSQLKWNPPTTGPIRAEVRWGALWTSPSPPDELGVDIYLPHHVRIDSLTVEIGVQGATWLTPRTPASPEQAMTWISSGLNDAYTTGGWINLSHSRETDRTILAAVAAGKPVRLTVKSGRATIAVGTIHTAGIAARDVLIERLRARIKAQDPAICNDKPDKIHYAVEPAKGPAKYTFACDNPDGTETPITVTLDKPPVYDMCPELLAKAPRPETHK
jgi:hypothetical protein